MSEEVDLSRIESKVLQENYLLGLGFRDGWVFLRVDRREWFPLLYDPEEEFGPDAFYGSGLTSLASGSYIKAKELKSDTLASTNILHPTEKLRVYQIFYCVSPRLCRVFPHVPVQTAINVLDAGIYSETYPIFGFIDGVESPFNNPSPRSVLYIPYNLKPGFAFYNPSPNPIRPLLQFWINRLNVHVIKDADLIMKILERRVECALPTVGGIEGAAYSIPDVYGVKPIQLGATRREVEEAVK